MAGFNYQMIVMTQGTTCRMEEETAEENCELDPNGVVSSPVHSVVYREGARGVQQPKMTREARSTSWKAPKKAPPPELT